MLLKHSLLLYSTKEKPSSQELRPNIENFVCNTLAHKSAQLENKMLNVLPSVTLRLKLAHKGTEAVYRHKEPRALWALCLLGCLPQLKEVLC
jgi:hypothetical protein